MPISDQLEHVSIDSIVVIRSDRQRSTLDTADLQRSISKVGLINAPVVREDDVLGLLLVAGERRLEACRALGWTTIPVRRFDQLSPVEAQLIELEENIKRTDLEWPDLVRAVYKIHHLYLSLDPDWTAAETASACSLTGGTISLYLKVAGEMGAGNARVIGAGTVREAYNVIDRQEQRRLGNALEQLLTLPTPEEAEALSPSTIVQFKPSSPPSLKLSCMRISWNGLQPTAAQNSIFSIATSPTASTLFQANKAAPLTLLSTKTPKKPTSICSTASVSIFPR